MAAPNELDQLDSHGLTPLMYAVAYKRFPIVEFFSERRIGLNTKDPDDCTPLFYANDFDCAAKLIKEGAWIFSRNKANFDVFETWLQHEKFDLVKKVMTLKNRQDYLFSTEHLEMAGQKFGEDSPQFFNANSIQYDEDIRRNIKLRWGEN